MGGVHLIAHVDDGDALVQAGVDKLVVVAADDGEAVGHARLGQGVDHQPATGQPALLPAGLDRAARHFLDELHILLVGHLVAQPDQSGAVGQAGSATQRRTVGVGHLQDGVHHQARIGRVLPAGLHLGAHV